MATKKFTKEFLKEEILWGGRGNPREPVLISNRIIENTRWSIIHEIVFRDADGLFYQTTYSVGATEMQDEGPWEYEDDEIECAQVHPVEKTAIVYEPVP